MGTINGFNVGGVNAICDGVTSSYSISTGEVVIETYSFPANYFKEGDILQVQGAYFKNTTNTVSVRIYWNNTPDLTSPTLLGISSIGTGDRYLPIMRSIAIVSATTSLVYATNIVNETDFGDAAGVEFTQPISTVTGLDWSIDGYIVVSLQDSTAGTEGKYYFTVII